jgi:DNA-binding MarR family transcriptional regulator
MARAGKDALAEEAWGLVIAMMASRRDAAFDVAASYGLTPGDMKSLLTLGDDDAPTMSVLAETWACDASNVTWLVDRLEQGGLVERRPSTTDRRAKTVALTERGRQARRELQAAFTKAPAPLMELSRDDLETLTQLLRRSRLEPLGIHDLMHVIAPRPRHAPGLHDVPPDVCAT